MSEKSVDGITQWVLGLLYTVGWLYRKMTLTTAMFFTMGVYIALSGNTKGIHDWAVTDGWPIWVALSLFVDGVINRSRELRFKKVVREGLRNYLSAEDDEQRNSMLWQIEIDVEKY